MEEGAGEEPGALDARCAQACRLGRDALVDGATRLVCAVRVVVETAQHGGVGGQGPGRCAVGAGEEQTLCREAVEGGAGRGRVPVGSEPIGPQAVDADEDDCVDLGRASDLERGLEGLFATTSDGCCRQAADQRAAKSTSESRGPGAHLQSSAVPMPGTSIASGRQIPRLRSPVSPKPKKCKRAVIPMFRGGG